jgi:hypothetical protein
LFTVPEFIFRCFSTIYTADRHNVNIELRSGTEYSIFVQTQPQHQFCTFDNNDEIDGTILSDDVVLHLSCIESTPEPTKHPVTNQPTEHPVTRNPSNNPTFEPTYEPTPAPSTSPSPAPEIIQKVRYVQKVVPPPQPEVMDTPGRVKIGLPVVVSMKDFFLNIGGLYKSADNTEYDGLTWGNLAIAVQHNDEVAVAGLIQDFLAQSTEISREDNIQKVDVPKFFNYIRTLVSEDEESIIASPPSKISSTE